ncbi:MAG TPA: T9SS type A sorting domain-containing protein [Ignavibacteria bacterium]|nr:T9SS type A sorting domain-containing protein [Ignavibacteria bacterium]HMR38929.1 T9SS type A sorting domain-containing protein [Ignavibacteria bacterium]
MKNKISKIIWLTVIFILIISTPYSYPQIFPWSPVQKITSGFNDKNPSFGAKQEEFVLLFDWEFMVFERHQDTSSQICILKMDTYGPIDSVLYISGNSGFNRNPSISYCSSNSFYFGSITNSLALWESERNGRWDIYGAYYSASSGWQQPFAIDTSGYDKFHPRSVCIDSTNFAITYERNNDIIFKIVNGQTHSISYDTNLTANESAVCKNPFISRYYSLYVSFEKQKADSSYAVNYKRSNTLPNWTESDTTAFEGNNINNGFVNDFGGLVSVFSSDRLGNYNIYGTAFDSFEGQKPILIDTASDNYDYESYLIPVVTDGSFYNQANAYIRKTDSLKIFLTQFNYVIDSVNISDTAEAVSLTLNRGLKFGMYDALVWVVFNKDSMNYSGLYGKSVQIIFADIRQISNNVPEKPELYQNYPNPFNPVTKIKFDIPQITSNNASNVKLIIYDRLGREVEILVDKQLGPGTYEVTWDADRYSSGIYFYRLESGNLAETKKLMLLK